MANEIITDPRVAFNFQPRIRSAIVEALKLSYDDFFDAVVNMRTTLSTTANGTDYYRVNGPWKFLVYEIRGHLAFNAIGSELVGNTSRYVGVGGAQNRTLLAALNARVSLTLPDQDNTEMFLQQMTNGDGDQQGFMRLSSLFPPFGGPIRFAVGNDVMPLIIPGNQRLKMSIQLQDVADSDYTTNMAFATEYGLDFCGIMVRTKDG